MADFTITVSNSIRSFGPAPSTKWGSTYAMVWGSSKWGEGSIDLAADVEKLLTNSVAMSGAVNTFDIVNLISNSFVLTSETVSEYLQTANGYYFVFTGPTTQAEDRNQTSYTSGIAGSTSWTQASQAGGTWT